MIFNIECCGGNWWRFLWCIMMKLPKKWKICGEAIAKKLYIFLSSLGIGRFQKSCGISVVENRKPWIGLAPINMARKTITRYYPLNDILSLPSRHLLYYSLTGRQLYTGFSVQTLSSNHLSKRICASLCYLSCLCGFLAQLTDIILRLQSGKQEFWFVFHTWILARRQISGSQNQSWLSPIYLSLQRFKPHMLVCTFGFKRSANPASYIEIVSRGGQD